MTSRRDLILSAPMPGERPLKGLSELSLRLARDLAMDQIHEARRTGDDIRRVDGLLILMRVRGEYATRVHEANRARAA